MKKRTRILIAIVFFGIAALCGFHLFPEESELYLKSDVSNFKNVMLPVTIILSIIVTLLIIFDKNEFGKTIWSKLTSVLYLIAMSYILHPLVSDSITTAILKMNRLSSKEHISEKFIVTYKGSFGEQDYTIWGRIPNKTPYGQTDKINLSKETYFKIKENQKIEITSEIGLFGIPYNPTLKK